MKKNGLSNTFFSSWTCFWPSCVSIVCCGHLLSTEQGVFTWSLVSWMRKVRYFGDNFKSMAVLCAFNHPRLLSCIVLPRPIFFVGSFARVLLKIYPTISRQQCMGRIRGVRNFRYSPTFYCHDCVTRSTNNYDNMFAIHVPVFLL